eukprot:5556538-Alexandrium_andersonii.AAC.1
MPVQGLPESIHGPLHLGGGPAALVWRKAYPSMSTLEFGLDICLFRISDLGKVSSLRPVGVSNSRSLQRRRRRPE